MANDRISRLHELASKVDSHLNEFEGDAAVAEAPASDFRERMEKGRKRKKRREVAGRLAVAGAGVGGAVAAKQAVMKNKDQLKEAGKTAVFRGMRKGAEGMKAAAKQAEKLSGAKYRPRVQKTANALRKGAKVLRKGSMKFFAGRLADMAGQLNELERA